MGKKCRVWHDWSKQHLVETYSKQLIQVSICETCGLFDTAGISLNAINRDQLMDIWNLYHGPKAVKSELEGNADSTLQSFPEISLPVQAVPLETVSTEKWVMPEWMVPFGQKFLYGYSKEEVENQMASGHSDVIHRVSLLQTLHSQGLLG